MFKAKLGFKFRSNLLFFVGEGGGGGGQSIGVAVKDKTMKMTAKMCCHLHNCSSVWEGTHVVWIFRGQLKSAQSIKYVLKNFNEAAEGEKCNEL
jgi:hypothetical protein